MEKDVLALIKERHSVRSYKQMPIADDIKQEIDAFLDKLNEESGLKFMLVEKKLKRFS